jgi:hypothetical protein
LDQADDDRVRGAAGADRGHGVLFATARDGISALSLQQALEIGSYQTAWAMLGRLRSVLVRPGRDLLAGRVEIAAQPLT